MFFWIIYQKTKKFIIIIRHYTTMPLIGAALSGSLLFCVFVEAIISLWYTILWRGTKNVIILYIGWKGGSKIRFWRYVTLHGPLTLQGYYTVTMSYQNLNFKMQKCSIFCVSSLGPISELHSRTSLFKCLIISLPLVLNFLLVFLWVLYAFTAPMCNTWKLM